VMVGWPQFVRMFSNSPTAPSIALNDESEIMRAEIPSGSVKTNNIQSCPLGCDMAHDVHAAQRCIPLALDNSQHAIADTLAELGSVGSSAIWHKLDFATVRTSQLPLLSSCSSYDYNKFKSILYFSKALNDTTHDATQNRCRREAEILSWRRKAVTSAQVTTRVSSQRPARCGG